MVPGFIVAARCCLVGLRRLYRRHEAEAAIAAPNQGTSAPEQFSGSLAGVSSLEESRAWLLTE